MRFLIEICGNLLHNKRMILNLAKDDFKIRFAGARLGSIWGFIQPLVTILVYWFVFQVGFKNGSRPDGTPYILWLIAGMVPWFFFSEAWTTSTNCLYEYSFLVKKVVFNLELLPIIKILSALIVHLFFIDILLVFYAAYGYYLNIYMIQIVYYLFCELILIYGLSLVSCAFAAFLKDTAMVIGIILQLFFWMIPIVWAPENISAGILLILKVNPLYYLIDGYRDAMINHVWFWDKPLYTVYFWTFVLILYFLGIHAYKKLKPFFADVL